MKLLIKNGLILTMDNNKRKFLGNIGISNDKIETISEEPLDEKYFDKILDAKGLVVMPGFVQPHIHLCQSLFRGTADDLELLDWLKLRIWPQEGAHDEESIYWSAWLGIGELLKSGTTSIVDMETVHYTDNAIQAIYESGIRAITGKVMMDYGSDVPKSLMESKDFSIDESTRLLNKWHQKDSGRIEYAFTPRFVVSCSEELLLQVARLSKEYGVKVHTHASENQGEIAFVQQDRGMRNITYLKKVGLLNENLILAHCIWLDEAEIEDLRVSHTKIAHCPSSNTKLSSGVAKIPELRELGIDIGIASDGAPCSNSLDMFSEMRLASLLQKVRKGPKTMNCHEVLEMATMGGARVMGKEKEIGSLEVGKKADIILLNLNTLQTTPSYGVEVESQIVFSAGRDNVVTTIVNGEILVENNKLLRKEEGTIIKNCNNSLERIRRSLKL